MAPDLEGCDFLVDPNLAAWIAFFSVVLNALQAVALAYINARYQRLNGRAKNVTPPEPPASSSTPARGESSSTDSPPRKPPCRG